MHCTSTTSPLNHWLSFYDCLAPDSLAYQGLCNIQDREADRAWLSDPSPFSCFAGNEVPSKEHHELKPYVHHLHVIDNQQALFELSHRIEPRVWAYTASYNLVTAALWIKWMFMPSMLLPYIRTVYWVLSVAHTTYAGKSGKSQQRSYSQSGRANVVPSMLVTGTEGSGAASFELKELGFCGNIIWSSLAFNADSASIRMKEIIVSQQQNISTSNMRQGDWFSVHHSTYLANSRLPKCRCQKYCAICAAPLSPLEDLIWDKCRQPRMGI